MAAAKKTDDECDTQDKAGEDILVAGPRLVPVPTPVINSPLRDKTLISLNDSHYDLDTTLATINFDLPISTASKNVSSNLLPCLTTESDPDLTRYETSPKPSEAIDEECDYVTVDCTNYALPAAIVTS